MEIYLTQSGIGECILIRCGEKEKKVNMIIDSGVGISSFERPLNTIKGNKENIDMLVFTHDDNDHINGAKKLLEKINNNNGEVFLGVPENKMIFNFGENSKKQLLAAQDMYDIAQSMLKEGIDFRKIGLVLADDFWGGKVNGNIIQLRWSVENDKVESEVIRFPTEEDLKTGKEHLEIVILSPDKELLTRYVKKAWDEIHDIGLSSENKKQDKDEWKKTIQYWIEHERSIGDDMSLSNASSIAFLIEYKGVCGLVAGDAHPDTMIKYGKQYLSNKCKQYFDLDFIKLPHHGSSYNINKEFFDVFRTNTYLLSTKGHRAYKHPGKVILAEMAKSNNRDGDIYIFTNYAWWQSREIEEYWDNDIKKVSGYKGECELKIGDSRVRKIHFEKLKITEKIKIREGELTFSV